MQQLRNLVVFKAFGDEEGNNEPGAQVPITDTPEFQETGLLRALLSWVGMLESLMPTPGMK
ncbi:hypothetical protein D3C76_1435040 [compost metagenome]